ncbi:MAG TPA: hypothetical protein VNY83_07865 [Solirubrobacterales bacterium]|nr:hypothetical protein [Solirubrobacterales bacterium]
MFALLTSIWLSAGPISKASAIEQNFCTNYWAAPYGQAGDRCKSTVRAFLGGVWVYSHEHSACVDALNTSEGLVTSWHCTFGPEGEQFLYLGYERNLKGIVRNNTTGASAHISGKEIW